MGGTLDRCKERCSGDFNFVQNNAKEFKDLPGAPNAGSAAAARQSSAKSWFAGTDMVLRRFDV